MTTIDSKYLEQIKEELNRDIHQLIDVNRKPSGGKVYIGNVESFADGIGIISGLDKAKIGQKVIFPTSTNRAEEEIFGQIIDIDEDTVSCVVFGEERFVKEGDEVTLDTAEDVLSVFASETQLGHVIDPFGRPMDISENPEEEVTDSQQALELPDIWSKITGKKNFEYKFIAIEREAPPLISRSPIDTPLHIGIKAVDTMMPIGLGQRMLVIGDRGTGKTAISIAGMINQAKLNKNRDEQDKIVFIYVAIGKKISEIVSIKNILIENNAAEDSIIVATKANDPASLLYIAPFAGCSLGEYFRDKGRQAVIIYDDLTKHANAYRHISLLLKRAPGREAFPGDIFYLHSRLLERASSVFYEENDEGNLIYSKPNTDKKKIIGTLTAFPIIETKENDFSAFVPTNVISITDGQIYLDFNLFNEEVLPAVHTGLSVSRVGGHAQTVLMKKLSKNLKSDLAIYKEKKKYQSFGFDLSPEDLIIINHGVRSYAYLKQALNETAQEKEQLTDLMILEIQKLIETEFYHHKLKGEFFGSEDISSFDSLSLAQSAFDKYAKKNGLTPEGKEITEKEMKKFTQSGYADYEELQNLIINSSVLISFISGILEQYADNQTD